jgi:hypothetical protein
MRFALPTMPAPVIQLLTPEKLFYHEWDFWLTLFTFVLAGMTAWLALETRFLRRDSAESIKAARESAESTYQLLRASVRPVINVELGFIERIGSDSLTGIFTNQVVITISNKGTAALVLERVIATWEHDGEGLVGEIESPGFRKLVLASGNHQKERIQTFAHNSEPQIDHFDSWRDMFQVEIQCRDLGGVTPITYLYRPADGVRLVTDNNPDL